MNEPMGALVGGGYTQGYDFAAAQAQANFQQRRWQAIDIVLRARGSQDTAVDTLLAEAEKVAAWLAVTPDGQLARPQ